MVKKIRTTNAREISRKKEEESSQVYSESWENVANNNNNNNAQRVNEKWEFVFKNRCN